LVTVGATACATGYYYRPAPDVEDGVWVQTRLMHIRGPAAQPAVDDGFRGERPPVGDVDVASPPPVLLAATRAVVTTAIGALSKIWLTWMNRMSVEGELGTLVEAVEGRPEDTPLITVANHASVLDDPALLAAMLPWRIVLQPSKHRWAICTQEVCFKDDLIAAFVGCGKVLPIKRGAGVDQPQLLELCRHAAAGRWVHIFPEGKINQGDTLGANFVGVRPASDVAGCGGGRLKWGIGKIIAHAPKTPKVVPFYAVGMRDLLPCSPVDGHLYPVQLGRLVGRDVNVDVGTEVEFTDLIEEHTKEHGPLWKYGPSPQAEDGDWRERWKSNDAERRLYSKITHRIEAALRTLEDRHRTILSKPHPLAQDSRDSGGVTEPPRRHLLQQQEKREPKTPNRLVERKAAEASSAAASASTGNIEK